MSIDWVTFTTVYYSRTYTGRKYKRFTESVVYELKNGLKSHCTMCTSLLPDLWPYHECLEKNCVGYCYGKAHVHVAQHVNSQMNNLGNLSIHKLNSSYFMECFNPENKKPEDKQTCMACSIWQDLFCIESPVLYLHEKDSFRVNQQKVW